ncbi:MAG: acyltransferase [Burkholderiales bacterium]|nr:acyltransferase [Burkholderiales bacterium]
MPFPSIKAALGRLLRVLTRPRMLYGLRRHDGAWLPHTRVGSSTDLLHPERLDIGDHVYVGQFNLVDASGGLRIGEGTQITSHVTILTHSSHQAVRLAGRQYWGHPQPPGLVRQPTDIGPWCFIGAHSVIAPGSRLGRGVLVRAFSYVDGQFPDFAVVGGQPARVIGDVRDLDAAWLERETTLTSQYCGGGLPPRP